MSQLHAAPQVTFTLEHRSVPAEQVREAPADGGPSAAGAAFAAFAALHAACGSAITAINAQNWGPFSNSGSCDYDCGFKEQRWEWHGDATSYVQGTAVPAVRGMDFSSSFTTAFGPVQTWLDSDLPGHTTAINGAIATINQIDAQIRSTGMQTPIQVRALAQAFSVVSGEVQGSLNEANAALKNMASFLTWIGSPSISPQPFQAVVDSQITTSMNDLIGDVACGGGDITSQYNAMKVVVDTSFANLQTPFNTVNTQLAAATDAGDVVSGVFLNLQSRSQVVTDFLNKALSLPPISPLRGDYLNIAAQGWASLVTYAQAQLSH